MIKSVRERAGLLRWVLREEDESCWYLYLGNDYLGQIAQTHSGWCIYAVEFGFWGQHVYKTARLPAAVLVNVARALMGLIRA